MAVPDVGSRWTVPAGAIYSDAEDDEPDFQATVSAFITASSIVRLHCDGDGKGEYAELALDNFNSRCSRIAQTQREKDAARFRSNQQNAVGEKCTFAAQRQRQEAARAKMAEVQG